MLPQEIRAEINRRNAQNSTGPRTEEGKKRSSMNALRHGLTGQIVVMPEEDLKAFNAFEQSFVEELKPVGAVEAQLVQVIVDASWKMNRSKAWQDQILCGQMLAESGEPDANGLEPELAMALTIAEIVSRSTKDLCNFSIYETRNFNLMRKAHQDLKVLQKERLEARSDELYDAAKLMIKHEKRELDKHETREKAAGKAADRGEPTPEPYVMLPYNPAVDGFDFSISEIRDYRRRHPLVG